MSGNDAKLQDLVPDVSRETIIRLEGYEAAMRKWAARINLVGASTLEDFWTRHILDSAQLYHLAGRHWRKWVDLGSGAGLPGAVIAVLASGSEREVWLVESNGKKAAFLSSVLAELAPDARVLRARAETAFAATGPCEILSARALAPLPRLLDLADPWLSTGAHALFPKGRGHGEEVEKARDAWDFSLLEEPSVTDSSSRILILDRVRRKTRL